MRAIVLEKLYLLSLTPYRYFKKNKPWDVTTEELLEYPEGSLGQCLGQFLKEHGFNIQEKLESHDVFHVLTGTGITVPEEVGMQFYLMGNGKRSIYLFTVIFLGGLFYLEHIQYFFHNYKKGKSALSFYHLDFPKLLQHPLGRIQSTFLIQ